MEGSEHPLVCKTTNDDIEQEDALFSRARSASVQTRRSWPLLPTLQIINSMGSNNEHNFSVRRPTIDEIVETKSVDSSESESSTSSGFGMKEKDEIFDSHDVEDMPNDINRRGSTLDLPKKDSAGTLVEAALDQDEARDRHVQFQNHIAEAGSLVQRMISTRYPSISNEHHNIIEETAEQTHNDDMEMQSQRSPLSGANLDHGGGSVLASLMKLETQRRPTVKKKTIKKKKKVNISL